MATTERTCTERDCDRRHHARGRCKTHYNRWLRAREGDTPRCAAAGCARAATSHSWCHAHYQRWWRNGEAADERPLRDQQADTCRVAGCASRRHARDLCTTHYQRWRQRGDVAADSPIGELPRPKRPRTSRGWTTAGYRYVPVDADEAHLVDGAQYAAEHRLVMARQLGRPLSAGQRVRDRVTHAVELLRRYAPHLLAEHA